VQDYNHFTIWTLVKNTSELYIGPPEVRIK